MQTNRIASPEAGDKLAKILSYLAVDPANRHLLAAAIDAYLSLGQNEDAARCARAALTFHPKDPFFRHRYGNVLIAQDKLTEAEQVLIALHAEVADMNIARNLAYIYFRQKKYTEAGDTLLPYIDVPGVSPAIATLLLRCLHHSGKVKQALEIVWRRLDDFSADPEFLAVASLLCLDGGQPEEAKKFSDAAQAEGSHPIEALVTGGTVALGHGDVEAANAQFTKALEINPADGRTWSGLGLASLLKQDIAGAMEQLKYATTCMPQHIGTWHALAWCKIVTRDVDGAEAIYQKVLAMDRNFGESHGGMAVVAALKGNHAVAKKYIEVALRLDPRGLSARYAQMIMSGEVKDAVQFRQWITQIMFGRAVNFTDLLTKWLKN
jgi:Flp pilus assembly protein TadD